ncbi:autotransporter outer membrane beta-barrel domain-containing protein, partial [Methylobacterium tardum]
GDLSAVTVAAGATLALADSETVGSLAGQGRVALGAARLTAGGDGTSTTFAGTLDGTGGLTKAGAGTLTLTGTSTYSGPTTIAAGTLSAADAAALGTSVASVFAGGTLEESNVILANTLTLAGTGAGGVGALTGTGTAGVSGAITLAGNAALGGRGILTVSGTIGDGGSGYGLSKVGGGAAILTGASSYTGATTVWSGTLALAGAGSISASSGVALATGASFDISGLTGTGTTIAGLTDTAVGQAGTVTLGARTLAISNARGSFGGSITGIGGLTLTAGTQTLTGASTYAGLTTIAGGTLSLAAAGTIAASSGVALAAGASFDISGLTGTGTTIAGLTDATGQAGTITIGTKTLTLADASGSFGGTITGTGGLSLTGGRQILTGTSTYTGATTVADATLEIDGVLTASEVTVRRGGTLSGTGKIGDPLIEAGGRLAPGSAAAIGTLSITGPLTFAPGAFYTVRITPTSDDRTAVTGPVTIQGGTVQVLAGSGTYTPALRYTLLTATGGITGQFTSLQTTSNLAFLTPSLSYEAHGIALGFAQTAPLTSAATTTNQARIASALNGTGPTVTSTPTTAGGARPAVTTSVSATGTVTTAVSTGTGTTTVVSSPAAQVTTALLNQTASGAVRALNSLSGEIQGSAVIVRAQSALAAQGTLLEHLRFGAGSAGSPGLTGAAGQHFAPGTTLPAGYTAFTPDEPATGLVPVRPLAPRYTVWGQAFGVFGASDATRNTARLSRETGGFVLGAETGPGVLGDRLGSGLDGWRLGVAGGSGVTQFDATTRQSSGRIEGSFGAAYVTGTLGPVQVRLGAMYGRDALDTRRTVLFPGFSQAVSGRDGGSTLQGFGELGYRIGGAEHYVEPFVGVAALRLRQDRFTETGGSAALAVFGRTDMIETATAGVQAQTVVADLFGGAGPLLAQGLIGYRRAFGDVVPAALLAFRGSTAFRTAGAPLAPDAAMVTAGLNWAVAPGTVVGLSYDGQIGARTSDHAVKGSLSYRW